MQRQKRHLPNTPPNGYQIITVGKVRPDDLVWDSLENTWGRPTPVDYRNLGSDVQTFYRVARRNPDKETR